MKSEFLIVVCLTLTSFFFVGLNAQQNIAYSDGDVETLTSTRLKLKRIQKTLEAIRESKDPSFIAQTGSTLSSIIKELACIAGALGLGIGCAYLIWSSRYYGGSLSDLELRRTTTSRPLSNYDPLGITIETTTSELKNPNSLATLVALAIVGTLLTYIAEKVIGKLLTSSPQNDNLLEKTISSLEQATMDIDSNIKRIRQAQAKALASQQ